MVLLIIWYISFQRIEIRCYNIGRGYASTFIYYIDRKWLKALEISFIKQETGEAMSKKKKEHKN